MLSAVLLAIGTAAWLGPAGRGQYSLVTSTANLIGQVAGLSLFIGAANAFHAHHPQAIRYLLTISLRITATLWILSLIVALIHTRVPRPSLTNWIFILLLSGFVVLQLYTSRTLQGIGQSTTFARLALLQAGISLFLGLPIAYITHRPAGVIAAWAASLLITLVCALWNLRTYFSTPDDTPLPPVIRTSVSAHIGTMGQQLLLRADVPILSLIVPLASLGIYSIASPVANIVFAIAEAVGLSLFGNSQSRRNQISSHTLRRRLLMLYFAASIATAACAWCVVIFAIPRFLPEYRSAITLIALILPGAIIQGYSRITLSSLTAQSAQSATLRVGICSALLAILYIPAAIIAGVTGAAIASSLIYILQAAVVLQITRTHERSRP